MSGFIGDESYNTFDVDVWIIFISKEIYITNGAAASHPSPPMFPHSPLYLPTTGNSMQELFQYLQILLHPDVIKFDFLWHCDVIVLDF